MLNRDFFTFDEGVELLGGDREAVRQSLLRGQLSLYVEFKSVMSEAFADERTYPSSGRTKFSTWSDARFAEREEFSNGTRPFLLNGWFLVHAVHREALARNGDLPSIWILPSDFDIPEVFDARQRTRLADTWFLSQDIEKRIIETAEPPTPNDRRDMDERERSSLLRIIRALDVMATLPPRGAATSIETQLQTLGFTKPRDATIRKIIEQARALKPDANPQ